MSWAIIKESQWNELLTLYNSGHFPKDTLMVLAGTAFPRRQSASPHNNTQTHAASSPTHDSFQSISSAPNHRPTLSHHLTHPLQNDARGPANVIPPALLPPSVDLHVTAARLDVADADLPQGLTPLHKAVFKNDTVQVSNILREDRGQINAQDAYGRTALHFAAAVGNLRMIQMLCDNGANTQINDEDGLTPLYLAAQCEHPGAANLLAHFMKDAPFEPIWYTTAAVQEAVKAHSARGKTGNFSDIDDLTTKLTGVSVDSLLNNPINLSKYIAHLHSWDEETFGAQSEGWTLSDVPPMRIRSLLTILLSKMNPPPELTEQNGGPNLRNALCQEISTQLETLRLAHRLDRLANIDNDAIRAQLTTMESAQIIERVLHQNLGHEISLPLGYPGHAIYGGLVRDKVNRENVVTFRLDNLGGGFPRGHKVDSSGRVLPLMFHIPESYLATPEGRDNVNALFAKLLEYKYHGASSADMLYGDLFKFIDILKKKYDPGLIENRVALSSISPKKRQSVGNCALKNHSAGMAARLGRSLFKWVKSREIEVTENRIFDYVFTRAAFAEKQAMKDILSLREMVSKGENIDYNELKRFLDKPAHRLAASTLNFEQLRNVMQNSSADVLQLLVEHGANVTLKDRSEDTLLHVAARLGSASMVDILIKASVTIDATNNLGRSALHIAAAAGHNDVIKSLVAAGANRDLADKTGKTPRELINQRAEEALAMIKSMG